MPQLLYGAGKLKYIMYFMHLIEGNPISEQYFEEGLIHFKKEFNIELTLFPAYNPEMLSPELRFQEYKVSTHGRKLKLPMHVTEKACFCTHFELWKRCIKLGRSIACFEHDARKNLKIEADYDLKFKFERFIDKGRDYQKDAGIAILGTPPATSYMISPEFAEGIVKATYKYMNFNDGLNMQADTFIMYYAELKNGREPSRRKVFKQSKEYGHIIDHGPRPEKISDVSNLAIENKTNDRMET
jgi:hypothetical protein